MIKKVVDYDKHEAHYFDISNDLTIKLDKDVLIDKLLEEEERQQNNWNELKNRTQKKIEQLEYYNEQFKTSPLKTSPYTPQIETLKLTLKDMQELEGNNE